MNYNNLISGFIVDTTIKENVYLLGFLWADGWIRNKGYVHAVGLSLVKEDFLMIEPLLRMFGINSFHERQRKLKGENFGRISRGCFIQNKSIVDFLIENNYDKKSGYSPDKILLLIPENLKHYFWRGYMDGDGCISSKLKKREVALWSVINQDWSFAMSLANKLNITYQIYTYNRKGGRHQSSVFRIGKIDDIIKFCDYIYQNYDKMGLERKYKKYLECKILQTNTHRKTSKYKGIFLANNTGRWGATFYGENKLREHIGWFSTEEDAHTALVKYLPNNVVI